MLMVNPEPGHQVAKRNQKQSMINVKEIKSTHESQKFKSSHGKRACNPKISIKASSQRAKPSNIQGKQWQINTHNNQELSKSIMQRPED